MWASDCVRVCVHACVRVCVYVRVYIFVCAFLYVYVHTHIELVQSLIDLYTQEPQILLFVCSLSCVVHMPAATYIYI